MWSKKSSIGSNLEESRLQKFSGSGKIALFAVKVTQFCQRGIYMYFVIQNYFEKLDMMQFRLVEVVISIVSMSVLFITVGK